MTKKSKDVSDKIVSFLYFENNYKTIDVIDAIADELDVLIDAYPNEKIHFTQVTNNPFVCITSTVTFSIGKIDENIISEYQLLKLEELLGDKNVE